MRTVVKQVFAVSILQIMMLGMLWAQRDDVLSAGVMTWDEGMVVRYKAMMVPPFKDGDYHGWTGGETITRNGVSRYFVDGHKATYFGYDLVIERLDSTLIVPLGKFRPYSVKFRPLSLKPEAVRAHYTGPEPVPVKLLAYPVERMVGDGEVISFDLVAKYGRGTVRITEILRFIGRQPKLTPAAF